MSVRSLLAAAWIVGAVALLLGYLLKALRMQMWLHRQRRALPAALRRDMENVFSAHGITRLPPIWLIDGVGQPFVWGMVRGSIYLPASLAEVKDSKLWTSLIGHEFSHVLRFDAAVNVLQVAAQVAFWFHPFVWWANRKIRQEREKCCDEATIARLHTRPEDYSSAIVEILASQHESIRPVPSLAIAGPIRNIEERIRTMLRPGKKFYRRASSVTATAVLLLALLTVPTARAKTETTTMSPEERTNALHEAAGAGDVEQVRLLISQGADANEKAKNGRTPLHAAAWYGRRDVAEVLIAKGANINQIDASGQTPLHLAARYDGPKSLPELLLAKGANVNARDKAGNTPLHSAAGYQHVETDLLELLIAKGADIRAVNEAGQTPLHYAVRSNRPHNDVVDFLLAKGADVNAKDRSGCTPLHVPAGGNPSVSEYLRQYLASN